MRNGADLMTEERATTTRLQHSPLHDEHLRLGASLIDFGGWEMPVKYSGIIEEHHAVREAAEIGRASCRERV